MGRDIGTTRTAVKFEVLPRPPCHHRNSHATHTHTACVRAHVGRWADEGSIESVALKLRVGALGGLQTVNTNQSAAVVCVQLAVRPSAATLIHACTAWYTKKL